MKDTDASFRNSLDAAQPSPFGRWLPYRDPTEIVLIPTLSTAEKREILSSWASDARAVPDAPSLRRLDNGATIGIHDILEALKTLDAAEPETRGPRPKEFAPRRRRDPSHAWLPVMFRRRDSDDDDDPPPCPAVIAPLPGLPPFGAEASLEAA